MTTNYLLIVLIACLIPSGTVIWILITPLLLLIAPIVLLINKKQERVVKRAQTVANQDAELLRLADQILGMSKAELEAHDAKLD